MEEQWQLYDEQGRPLARGASKDDIYAKGLLHAASHVWIWRLHNGVVEILLQKRSETDETWPNLYDISAAGHIDLGEAPTDAAIRETREEIGIHIAESDLHLISVQKVYMTAENGKIENEFQWLYLYEMSGDTDFTLQVSEVASLQWQSLAAFRDAVKTQPASYVPHGELYFSTVINAIDFRLANN
jgi:isopentenyl-diphosphate Delta-isomerase